MPGSKKSPSSLQTLRARCRPAALHVLDRPRLALAGADLPSLNQYRTGFDMSCGSYGASSGRRLLRRLSERSGHKCCCLNSPRLSTLVSCFSLGGAPLQASMFLGPRFLQVHRGTSLSPRGRRRPIGQGQQLRSPG